MQSHCVECHGAKLTSVSRGKVSFYEGNKFVKWWLCRTHFQAMAGPTKITSVGLAPSSRTIRSLMRTLWPAKPVRKMDAAKSQLDEPCVHQIFCLQTFSCLFQSLIKFYSPLVVTTYLLAKTSLVIFSLPVLAAKMCTNSISIPLSCLDFFLSLSQCQG